MTVYQYRIAQFNSKHDTDMDAQFRQLVEEVGELAEALNREDSELLAEEIGDVVFVARSMAELEDIDVTEMVNQIAEENLEKDAETDGSKVTKSGLEDD